MKIKALAISQPWAELIVSGKKRVEVRTRNTFYRGWFYVYCAKKDTKEEVVHRFGFEDLPTGVVIGKAYLEKVKRYRDEKEFYKDSDLHLAQREDIELEGWGDKPKYGYFISRVERIKPFPVRGMPGFFDPSATTRIPRS